MDAIEKKIAAKAKALVRAWAKDENRIDPSDSLRMKVSVSIVRGKASSFAGRKPAVKVARNGKLRKATVLDTPVSDEDWQRTFAVGFRKGSAQRFVLNLLKSRDNAETQVGDVIQEQTCSSINIKLIDAGLDLRVYATPRRKSNSNECWPSKKIKMYHVRI